MKSNGIGCLVLSLALVSGVAGCNGGGAPATPLLDRAPAGETPPAPGGFSKRIPRLDGDARYVTYYGGWNQARIEAVWSARLVIGDFGASDLSPAMVRKLRYGRDGVQGTADDVTVIAYFSPMQERDDGGGARFGNGLGPLQIDRNGNILGPARGYASYYLDALTQDRATGETIAQGPDGRPDRTTSDTGFRINPADASWREHLREQAEELLIEQGCDGLFLDVLDAVHPNEPYAALIPQTYDTVRWLKRAYPSKYLVANRGFFLFESDPSVWYAKYNIRPFISAVMLENHYTEWSGGKGVWSPWAGYPSLTPQLNAESRKADGFRILVLDYLNPRQSDCASLLSRQRSAVRADGGGQWLNFLTNIELTSFGYTSCE